MHLLTDTRFAFTTYKTIKIPEDKHIFINYVYQTTLCTVDNTDFLILVRYFLTYHLYD
jgi:hypothetical protein